MKTITFYSYKGGVGRTLALSNIAKRLNEFGKKVFIIDFDLEAPGVHYKFKDFLPHTNIKLGLVDYIHKYDETGEIDSNIENYVKSFKFNNFSKTKINLMCAGDNYSSNYWKKLSSINWRDMFYNEDSDGIDFFINLKKAIKEKYNPDYILIDSRTGFTETSAITMSVLADEVVILAANNFENIEGSKQILKSLNKTLSLTGDRIKYHFVLTRIPGDNSPEGKIIKSKIINQTFNQLNVGEDENNKLVEKIFIIRTDRELEVNETLKLGLSKEMGLTSISNDYFTLLEAICDFTSDELENYNLILQSDQFLSKALASNTDESYKDFLEKALKLNKNNVDILFRLASYEFNNLLLNESIKHIQRAVEIEPNNALFLSFWGGALCISHRFNNDLKAGNKGLKLLEKALRIDSGNRIANVSIDVVLLNARKYLTEVTLNESRATHKKLLEKYPNSQLAYNFIAVDLHEHNCTKEAYENIYRALELDSDDAMCKTTLAEIHAKDKKENEFYYAIDQAIKANYGIEGFFYYHEFYDSYFQDEKFIKIIEKYNLLEKFEVLHKRYKELTSKS